MKNIDRQDIDDLTLFEKYYIRVVQGNFEEEKLIKKSVLYFLMVI